MGTTTKRYEEEKGKINKKTIAQLEAIAMDDRFSNLPESLQLHILSSLDTKHALQTSLASKTFLSTWTRIPVLEFNSFNFKSIRAFDNFVYNVLRHRDHSTNLKSLKFHRSKICNTKILKKVFDHAFSSSVNELEVHIQHTNRNNNKWPISPLSCFHSLTSLKLESQSYMICPFLGAMSRSFKNLTVLYLKHAFITDNDRFSGFPVLESLTLVDCQSKALSIHALRLLELKIASIESVKSCELVTPRLRLFEYRGHNFPLLRTGDCSLGVLEKVVIDFNGVCFVRHEKLMFDDLMGMLCALRSVKSLTVFSAVVQLLSFFPDELARRSSPFWELKELKMDFRYLLCQNLFERTCERSFERFEVPLGVRSYLLQNCPDAKFSYTNPMPGLREFTLM